MAFNASHLRPSTPRMASSARTDGYDSASSTDSEDTARTHSRSRAPFVSSSSATGPPHSVFLFPPARPSGRSSVSSTATSTPLPSRSTSPLPQFYSSNPSSSCPSDTDSESTSPLLRTVTRNPWWRENRRGWWSISRRRRKREPRFVRTLRKWLRYVIRHPFFPGQPITIVLTLILLSAFAIFLTLLLIYILNPDKEPLPWRAYCAYPSMSTSLDLYSPSSYPYSNPSSGKTVPPFPPANLDTLPPAGLFIGVFSVDSAFERRELVRTTWASHPRSRDGAGDGDDGEGTSRSVVRFILGQPRKDWERRIKLEMEMYNDIIILPIQENMNYGKTYTFFSWAAINAWVPPVYMESGVPPPQFSYSNRTSTPPPLASHDPFLAWEDINSGRSTPWVRPDFVIKVDDDSFVMLAELESRLRLELHAKQRVPDLRHREHGEFDKGEYTSIQFENSNMTTTSQSTVSSSPSIPAELLSSSSEPLSRSVPIVQDTDPLIYWGYLVSNRLHEFMAGELYGLSWSVVDWVAKDPTVKTLTRGAEDKQTAKWMRLHPRAREVRWTSERCWIYDHPRSGTVYSHGFLFPSEISRVKRSMKAYFEAPAQAVISAPTTPTVGSNTPAPAAWAHSSVSTFGVRYTPPLPDLTTSHSIEALVEGSDMSLLHEGSPMSPEYAWHHREGRKRRYESKRVGGTVVVHFIKKNMWYLETALALLEGEELSEAEKYESHRTVEDSANPPPTQLYSFHRPSKKHLRR